jgi:hypothetical protein
MIIEKGETMNRKSSNEYHGDGGGKSKKRSRLYNIWASMKKRCGNPNHTHYHRYGGRGIRVCDIWLNSYIDFKNWAVENRYKNTLQIDRINNDKGYSPQNCEWITKKENVQKGCATRRRLTFQDAENIRISILSQRALAKVYNVAKSAISNIKHYRTYKKDYNCDM